MLSVTVNRSVISLSQIAKHPQDIKILIVHTPLTLNIDSLYLFQSLIKLDLSNNNLTSFPHIGSLQRLKFLFLHQNKLTIYSFIGIFQKEGKKSELSNRIVWITFWDNKDLFLARHYAANQTSAIVFDRHLIVSQQRSPSINFDSEKFNFCSKQAEVSDILLKETSYVKDKEEQDLILDLWSDLRELRKRYLTIHPIIKIQSTWRGWAVREKIYRLSIFEKEQAELKINCFQQWKKIIKRQIKLRTFLKTIQIEEAKPHQLSISKRLIELARQAKTRLLHRKQNMKNQAKFYWWLKANLALLQDFYSLLEIPTSSAIYLCRSDWHLFQKFVVPYVRLFSQVQISINKNFKYQLISEYEVRQSSSKELIKLIQLNRKSLFIRNKPTKYPDIRPKIFQKTKKSKLRVHFKTSQIVKMKEISIKLEQKQVQNLEKMITINGDPQIIKDISRGIYFFNTRRITSPELATERINFFSKGHIVKISSAILIQRVWRGYVIRKKHSQSLKELIIKTKGAQIIQKWFRRIPFKRREIFKKIIKDKLRQIKSRVVLIELKEYFNFLSITQTGKFCLSDSLKIYRNNVQNKVCLFWDIQSPKIHIIQNIMFKVPPFDSRFLSQTLRIDDFQIKNRFPESINQHYYQCDSGFLFHLGTEVEIVHNGATRYLRVHYDSEQSKNFNLFVIFLLSYEWRTQESIKIFDFDTLYKRKFIKEPKQMNDLLFVSMKNENKTRFLEDYFQKQNVSVFSFKSKFFLNENANFKKIEDQISCLLVNLQKNDQQFQKQHERSHTERLKALLLKQPAKITHYQTYRSSRGENIIYRKKSLKKIGKLSNKSIESTEKFILTSQKGNAEDTPQRNIKSLTMLEHSSILSQDKSFLYSSKHRRQDSSVKMKTEEKSHTNAEDFIRRSLPMSIKIVKGKRSFQRYSSERQEPNVSLQLVHLPKTKSFLDKKEDIFTTGKRQKKLKQPKNRYLPVYQRQGSIINSKKLQNFLKKEGFN